jgi:hypothetical protein
VERLKVLITVKTYPQPSSRHEEIVCTAGIREGVGFVRLYPIRFRALADDLQYQKYQWVELDAVKRRDDPRPESYQPNIGTLRPVGPRLGTKDGWAERKRVVVPWASESMEELKARQQRDGTSLGLVKPAEIVDLAVAPSEREWDPQRVAWMQQAKLIGPDLRPLPRVPFYFRYRFRCDDARCRGHTYMIEDWELGRLYFRLCQATGDEEEAKAGVRTKFLDQMCAADRDTWLFVGTLRPPLHATWVVIGVFWPPRGHQLTLPLAGQPQTAGP